MSLVGGLEHLDYFSHHIGVMSSSQLTFTPWFFIGVGQPPTRWRSPAVAWGNPLTIPICSIYGIFTYKTGWFLWYIYHYLPTWSIWDRVAVVLSPRINRSSFMISIGQLGHLWHLWPGLQVSRSRVLMSIWTRGCLMSVQISNWFHPSSTVFWSNLHAILILSIFFKTSIYCTSIQWSYVHT